MTPETARNLRQTMEGLLTRDGRTTFSTVCMPTVQGLELVQDLEWYQDALANIRQAVRKTNPTARGLVELLRYLRDALERMPLPTEEDRCQRPMCYYSPYANLDRVFETPPVPPTPFGQMPKTWPYQPWDYEEFYSTIRPEGDKPT